MSRCLTIVVACVVVCGVLGVAALPVSGGPHASQLLIDDAWNETIDDDDTASDDDGSGDDEDDDSTVVDETLDTVTDGDDDDDSTVVDETLDTVTDGDDGDDSAVIDETLETVTEEEERSTEDDEVESDRDAELLAESDVLTSDAIDGMYTEGWEADDTSGNLAETEMDEWDTTDRVTSLTRSEPVRTLAALTHTTVEMVDDVRFFLVETVRETTQFIDSTVDLLTESLSLQADSEHTATDDFPEERVDAMHDVSGHESLATEDHIGAPPEENDSTEASGILDHGAFAVPGGLILVFVGLPGLFVLGVTALPVSMRSWVSRILPGWLRWDVLSTILRYSRFDDSDPLEHEIRHTVYSTIVEDTGVYLTELANRNELSLSVVRHHLRILESENLIRSQKIRGKRRYYPIEATDTHLTAALSDPATRRILLALDARGPTRNDDLADRLGCNPSTVSHHLTSLERHGLVVRERQGRAVENRLPSTVAETVASERATPEAE